MSPTLMQSAIWIVAGGFLLVFLKRRKVNKS